VTVYFAPSARRQFLEALAYIASDDPAAARRFRDRVERTLRRLERFPRSGRRLPEFPTLPHREVVVRPYRFVYRMGGGVLWVVAVWHAAQSVKRPGRAVSRRPRAK
jgi:toxin ParE1/3/4